MPSYDFAGPRYDFAGKVALVTGGASGIGAACIRQFSANGAAVVIADLNAQAGAALAEAINGAGGNALFAAVDVADADSVQAAVDSAERHFGRLDFAVNSAGINGESNLLADFSLAGWRQVIDINLNGMFHSLRSEIPAMLRAGGGAIVNLSSIMGLVSSPTTPAYVAAKHAVAGMTKTAAQTYSARGVRVNAICPGYVETPMLMNSATEEMCAAAIAMHPIGRLGKADDIASVALFLCSDGAAFVTGGIYPVDGGYLTN
jgi:NAD(P)-dependent dehydrogenase (short-subunit alcohol dehydrogenase family)